MRIQTFLLGSLFSSIAAGCSADPHAASLQDNLGEGFVQALSDNANGLNTPYVAGSRFTITVQAGGNATDNGWTLTSSNPTVLSIGAAGGQSGNEYAAYAGGSGRATLTIRDKSGSVLDSEDVEVDVPTQIELSQQGLIIAGETPDKAVVSSVEVVNGGTGTFLVRYFSGVRELYGNNALKATGTQEALAATASTSVSIRDFVEITGAAMGSSTVVLTAGGATLNLPVVVVDPSAVKSISLGLPDESHAKENDPLYVFGHAIDGAGHDIYGASFAWTAAGNAVAGNGNPNDPTDLLVYQYHSAGTEEITASVDGHTSSGTVHGQPGTTSTTTSENVGCAVARGAGAPGSTAMGVLVGLAALAARRRRGAATVGA